MTCNTLMRRFSLAVAVAVGCMLLVVTTTARAADVYWDTNGMTAGSGNTGSTWDSGTNWTTDSTGSSATAGWADGNAAIFSAGTDGTGAWTVTIGGTVDPTSISFANNGNKTISGGSITTAGGLSISSAGRSTSNNYNINSQLTGTGSLTLAANGDTSDTGGGVGGNLYLDNTSNDFVGGITISSGVVSFNGDSVFGNTGNVITISGGGLVATANRTLFHDISLSGGGSKIFRVYGSSTFTSSGNISGSGNIRHTDGGTLALNGILSQTGGVEAVRGTTALANPSNSYTGMTFVTGATLRLDANGVIPDASNVLQYANPS